MLVLRIKRHNAADACFANVATQAGAGDALPTHGLLSQARIAY
jgi:hypothetical protein